MEKLTETPMKLIKLSSVNDEKNVPLDKISSNTDVPPLDDQIVTASTLKCKIQPRRRK